MVRRARRDREREGLSGALLVVFFFMKARQRRANLGLCGAPQARATAPSDASRSQVSGKHWRPRGAGRLRGFRGGREKTKVFMLVSQGGAAFGARRVENNGGDDEMRVSACPCGTGCEASDSSTGVADCVRFSLVAAKARSGPIVGIQLGVTAFRLPQKYAAYRAHIAADAPPTIDCTLDQSPSPASLCFLSQPPAIGFAKTQKKNTFCI